MKKKLSIRFKLIVSILPIVIISLNFLVFLIMYTSRTLILDRTDNEMISALGEHKNSIAGELNVIKAQANILASDIGRNYKKMSVEQLKGACESNVTSNKMVLGSGVWFEPNVYDKDEKYFGPYWYKELDSDNKETGKIIEEWGYSNAEYDYLSQEYYTNTMSMKAGDVDITDPYYDETSGLIMSTCSAPIYDGDKYIGCVSVDLMLTAFQEYLDNIKSEKDYTIWLVDNSYSYIYHPAIETAIVDGLTLDDSTEMGNLIKSIKSEDSGSHGTFKWDGKTRLLYWDTIPEIGWKMGLTANESDILADLNKMTKVSITLVAVAMVLCALVIILQANGVAKVLVKVRDFAKNLSDGDFTVTPLNINRNDELGEMADSLNNMYNNNSDVIRNINEGSSEVSNGAENLASTSSILLDKFNEITDAMERVNDAMTSTGAATEQVNASANEVNEQVSKLSDETKETKDKVMLIAEKAQEIELSGKASSENALKIAEERGSELEEATKQAEVVHEIETMADSINAIAGQINLLSLNASIEAARAGEHGRGFAVVAGEINKLASETKEAVEEIQDTISKVNDAFSILSESANKLLDFMKETVAPDYEKFITVGQEYGADAKMFGELSDNISEMVNYISDSMKQVSAAVGEIAESATQTSVSSSDVTENIESSAELVREVNDMASTSQEVAEKLDIIVKKFKFE